MKKRNLFLTAMLAVLLAFGLTFTGCKNDGGNTTSDGDSDIDLLVTALGGSAKATASGSTVTLTADATPVDAGGANGGWVDIPDGVTLVIPGGKQLTLSSDGLDFKGTSKLVIENTGKLVIPGNGGYIDVRVDAGIYGGTAASPNIAKTKLTAAKNSGGADGDKLHVAFTYQIDVVGSGDTANGGNIVLGKTLYAVSANTVASTGVAGALAGTPARDELQVTSAATITITGIN
jgi:hypothetical protein